MQRSRWAILWAVILILGGGVLLAQNFNLLGRFEASIWTYILGGLGLLFLLDFVTSRAVDWWALIPGCILVGMSAVIWLAERGDVPGEWAGSLTLFSIGAPFLLIYVLKRGDFWWALIPGGILVALSVIPILTLGVAGEMVGAFVLWGIGAPFLIVYLANRKNWWALIPGGTLLVIGLMPLAAYFKLDDQLTGGIFFVGLAAVFGLLYLLHRGDAAVSDAAGHGAQMRWALYPATALLIVGVLVAAIGQNWWPLTLIALGAVLLLRSIWPRKK